MSLLFFYPKIEKDVTSIGYRHQGFLLVRKRDHEHVTSNDLFFAMKLF